MSEREKFEEWAKSCSLFVGNDFAGEFAWNAWQAAIAAASQHAAQPKAAMTDERKKGPLWDAIQRACGELPEDCEIRLYMERGSGLVVWSDADGSDHLIEGEGFVSDDINEAIDAALASIPSTAEAQK